MDITGTIPSQDDVDQILALLTTVDHAQRTEDPDAFLEIFREDALWVTGHGKRLYGRPTIDAFTRQVLPGATTETYATYEPDHLLFVRPDIAVLNVNQTYVHRNGHLDRGTPVYVLAKDDNTWRIAAAQNTIVVPE
ncbi:SgcJ/EcaC family oxidoreductase [Kribbella sp. NPDC051770]|uniref:SgcJ/EcaC family oxidoreductase n=1 Tax=Kribbella sp. NPDC051770 TaxID=3155413 RepID=UPI003433C082